ncbi:MAG: EcsC family protein, partial [Sphingobacteriaceae bacterium]
LDTVSRKVQEKLNGYIPDKVHNAITIAIKQMIRGVLFGAKYITKKPVLGRSLEVCDIAAEEKIKIYQKTAAAEGGVTGAGGILLGLADFPLLLGIKLKLLFDLAATYGYDVKEYQERLFILYVFQLAFSSRQQQRLTYQHIANWQETVSTLPTDINQLDWQTLQQEYRDYLDIAKMAQLIPVIGAPVGFVVNYRLVRKLGNTAKNAYQLRYFQKSGC